MDCLVSIIMPVYQTEKYLKESVDSILRQSYKNFELLLIDDGSKDASGQMIDDYARIDNRIRSIHQKNQGVSVARNTGIDHAKGKYILFVDSDDLIDQDLLLRTIQMMEDQKLDLLWFCADTFSETGGEGEQLPDLLIGERILDNKNKKFDFIIREYLNCTILYAVWNKVYRTDTIKRNHIIFTEGVKVGEDLAFTLQYLAYADRVRGISDKLYDYRYHLESVTTKIGLSQIHIEEFHRFLFDVCHTFQKEEYEKSMIRAICVKAYDNQMMKVCRRKELKSAIQEVREKKKYRRQLLDFILHPISWVFYLPYGRRYKLNRFIDFIYCFLLAK